jgi:hypothetical protein
MNTDNKKTETKQCTIPSVGGSYVIRIYDQDLCSDWTYKNGLGTPNKYIDKKELIENLKNNGLEIVQFAFSSFGACYFFEVKGDYIGDIEFQKLETKVNDFNWHV